MPAESFDITTQQALEENLQGLTVSGKKRGRPRKVVEEEDEIIVCPKCKLDDPGDWSQCSGTCPMPESPHFKKAASPLAVSLPKDTFGNWKRSHVCETSKVFLEWFRECEKIVLEGWTLKIKQAKKYVFVVMSNGFETRPFAFVKKSTGDIHTPATKNQPFDHFVGNICDPETRLSVLTPYGVEAHWAWLPTHPDYKESLAMSSLSAYDTIDSEDDDASDE
jgi:hypothetical protein